jgi:hypothetical protein
MKALSNFHSVWLLYEMFQARVNRFDKTILIYDSLFILLKSLTLNLHVDIGASISKLLSVHSNFVVWVVLDWWMEIQ